MGISALKYPLVILIILTALAFLAPVVAVYVLPMESSGETVFKYVEGQNPMNHIVFTFNDEISKNLIVETAPLGWTYLQTDSGFILSDNLLYPGGSLSMQTALKDYLESGDRPYTVTGTTTEGDIITCNSVMTVNSMFLMQVFLLLDSLKIFLLVGAVALGIAEVLLQVRSRGKKPAGVVAAAVAPIPVVAPVVAQSGEQAYVVYAVSDLHMGSNLIYEVKKVKATKLQAKTNNWTFEDKDVIETTTVDKSKSNLFNKAQADRFRNWLKFIDGEIESQHPNSECHLIINGDFLDLWQAKVPAKIGDFDTESGLLAHVPLYYANRVDLILDRHIRKYCGTAFYNDEGTCLKSTFEEKIVGENPNYDVVADLVRFAAKQNRTVFYLIGNHDDPLYAGNVKEDPAFGFKGVDADGLVKHLRNRLSGVIEDLNSQGAGIPNSALDNFIVDKHYWNEQLSVYAEHGHVYDEINLKDGSKPSKG
ncbi:MAG: hypothetical protein NWF00_11525 [Candidatus Bathyarchaeota archaeon]|nr:hypothetical protein [Candidatus Bathyarchaeota archaeon]